MRAGPPIPAEIDAIARLTFLSKVPAPLSREILAMGRARALPGGAVFAHDPARPAVAIIVDGLVRSFLKSTGGRQMTVRYTRPGETLGLVQLLGAKLEIDAQTVTPTAMWVLPARRVRAMARESAALALALAEDCAERVVDAAEELALVTFGSVRQRVARHLLDLAAGARSAELVAAVTPQALADATGSVREVVARVLNELEERGVTRRTRGEVRILSATRLDAEARGEG